MDVSIIIVSWNARDYLDKCLYSIYNEGSSLQKEVIVVDNASSDGSQEMVKEKYPQTNLQMLNENLGFAKANNIGIKIASGEYLFLINSDVIVSTKTFERITKRFIEDQNVGLIGPKILTPAGIPQKSVMRFPNLLNTLCAALYLHKVHPIFPSTDMVPLDREMIVQVINGCFWATKKEALKTVGLLDETYFIYSEDVDWCKSFKNADYKVLFFPEVTAIHYGGASSKNAPIRFYVERYKAMMQYWKKFNPQTLAIYRGLLILHHLLRIIPGISLLFVWKDATYTIKKCSATIKMLLRY